MIFKNLLFAVIGAISASSFSQTPIQSPSLKETENFIINIVRDEDTHSTVLNFSFPHGGKWKNYFLRRTDLRQSIKFSEDPCVMSVYLSNLSVFDHEIGRNDSSTQTLKNLNGIKIKKDQQEITEFYSVEEQAPADVTLPETPVLYEVLLSFSNSNEQSNSSKSILLFFDDNVTAGRVAKAFAHAAILCGGGEKAPF